MFPIHTSDTPSDMKDAAQGPGLAPNDPVYSQMYPNIRHHMINNGMYLNRHYAASVCTPSRKQLLSGRSVWSQSNGDWLPIRPRYSLISDKLKQAGYTNHFVGKWCVFRSNSHTPLPSACNTPPRIITLSCDFVPAGIWATSHAEAGPRTAGSTHLGAFSFRASETNSIGSLVIPLLLMIC